MSEPITSAYVNAKNELHSIAPWAFLLRIDIDGTNGIFICGYDQSISFGGDLYVPFPMIIGPIPRTAEGDVDTIDITLSNVGREAGTLLDGTTPSVSKIIDRTCHLRMVLTTSLTDCMDLGEMSVQHAQVSLPNVVLAVGPYNLFEAPLPARRQNRNRCDYAEYGGLECQYDKTLPNLISGTHPLFDPTGCDLGLDTENGCVNHGLNEVANGKPRKHPLRF